MFVRINRSKSGYDSDGQQVAVGDYLVAFEYHPLHPPAHGQFEVEGEKFLRIYACVRPVTLKQLGHWMMGSVKIAGIEITLSGEFGNDGLPKCLADFSDADQDRLLDNLAEMPTDIAHQYWNSSGHNCVGPTADVIRNWAISTPALWPPRRLPQAPHED